VTACHRKDEFDPSKGRVCCIHFLPSDFKRDLKNELLGLPTVKRLQENAIPTKVSRLIAITKVVITSVMYKQETVSNTEELLPCFLFAFPP
jgi:hypothetical protein